MRPKIAERAEVPILRRRQSSNRYWIVFRPHVEDEGVEHALLATLSVGLIRDDGKLAAGQRQGRMRAAGEGRRPIDVREQLRLGRIADVVDSETAVAPRGVAAIAGDDHVMQRNALALWR